MERRRALVIAGTMTATVAMAGVALAANIGLLERAEADVGKLDAGSVSRLQGVTTTSVVEPVPEVTIIVQDVPVGGGATASAPSSPAATPPVPAPAPAPAAGSSGSTGDPAAHVGEEADDDRSGGSAGDEDDEDHEDEDHDDHEDHGGDDDD